MTVGSIYGESTTERFNVVVTQPNIEEGTYVKVYHEMYGWTLGKIEKLKRFIGKNNEEIITAEVITVGYVDAGGTVLFPKTPFKPDSRVFTADEALIKTILGIRSKKGAYLGLLEGYSIPVYLDIKKMVGKHMSVLAKTGCGKSYTVSVLIEELLKNNIPVIIIDPHGEYSSLRYENPDKAPMEKYNISGRGYSVHEYSPDLVSNPHAEKLTLDADFESDEIYEILPTKLNDTQKSILYNAVRQLKGRRYDIQDVIDLVKKSTVQARWNVIKGLEQLRDSNIFSGGKSMRVSDFVHPGEATIVNLRGAEPKIQQLVVAKISRDLFEEKKRGAIHDNVFYLIEEAHNFCPERSFEDAMSSPIIRTIASEGRKFGLYLCIVSQRPARVDKNVLSQCNTQIILRVTNPNDLRAIGQSIEGFTSWMEEKIKMLPVGHTLVVSDAVEHPIVVEVRVRETKDSGSKGSDKDGGSTSGSSEKCEEEDEPPMAVGKKKERSFLGRFFFKD